MERKGPATRFYEWYMKKKPYSTILIIILFIIIVVLVILQLYYIIGAIVVILWGYSQGGHVTLLGNIKFDIGDKFSGLNDEEQIEEIERFTKELIKGKFTGNYVINYKVLKRFMNQSIPGRLLEHLEISDEAGIKAAVGGRKKYTNQDILFIMGKLPTTVMKTYIRINTVDKEKEVVKSLFDYYLKSKKTKRILNRKKRK